MPAIYWIYVCVYMFVGDLYISNRWLKMPVHQETIVLKVTYKSCPCQSEYCKRSSSIWFMSH